MKNIVDIVNSQVISSVKRADDIDKAIYSNTNITFLLTGDLSSSKGYIDRLKDAGKIIFVHIDFIDGLSNTPSAIKFIAEQWQPHGIITTKSNLINYAKEKGLMTIQRIFLIDRNAVRRGLDIAHSCKPHAIEVLPGLMPDMIDELTKITHLPIIAGGLVNSKQQILAGLKAGALAISAGNPELWHYEL